MTYATMRATGRGKLVYWLRIAGIPYVFATEDIYPVFADSWYWTVAPLPLFAGVKPWLSWGSAAIDERISFIDGTLDVEPIPIEITDIGGEFTAMVEGWHRRTMTKLRLSLDQADVGGIEVESTASFANSGVVWIDLEAISYVGKDANTLGTISVARGYYGSHDVDHVVDAAAIPAKYPSVLDGPQVLANRRADIYAAEIDSNGEVGVSECVFRGFVASDITGQGGVAELKIDHISRMWSREVGAALPETVLKRGYWYSGSTDVRSPSTVFLWETNIDTGATTQAFATISVGYSDSWEGLRYAAQVALATATAAFTRTFTLGYEAVTSRSILMAGVHADYQIGISINRGDFLWALGFDEGPINFTADSANTVYFGADREPVPFCMEVPDPLVTTADATIEVDDGTRLTDNLCVCLGNNPYVKILNGGITGNTVTIENASLDEIYRFRWIMQEQKTPHIAIEDTEDLVVRHVIRFRDTSLQGVIERCFALTGSEPMTWRLLGFESTDFDFTELDDCLISVPHRLSHTVGCIREPTPAADIICDRLGVLGITPRITTSGKIGFARLKSPHESRCNTVELDSDVWEHATAGQVGTLYEGEPLLNELLIDHTYDYANRQWSRGDTRVIYDDGVSAAGKIKAKRYKLFGIHVTDSGYPLAYPSRIDLLNDIKHNAVGMHFGVYGRISPTTLIGATWTSRQHDLDCGEMVLLTHPCVVDVAEGAVGVTDRVAVVISRRNSLTTRENDQVGVILPVVANTGQIAPCALATAWNAGALQLTFAAVNLYSSGVGVDTDLQEFLVTHVVSFTEYDARAPALFGPSTITAKGANTIDLFADPFGGAFPATGVWMHWQTYDLCSADQQAWLFFADTTYGLGATPDEGYRWGL